MTATAYCPRCGRRVGATDLNLTWVCLLCRVRQNLWVFLGVLVLAAGMAWAAWRWGG